MVYGSVAMFWVGSDLRFCLRFVVKKNMLARTIFLALAGLSCGCNGRYGPHSDSIEASRTLWSPGIYPTTDFQYPKLGAWSKNNNFNLSKAQLLHATGGPSRGCVPRNPRANFRAQHQGIVCGCLLEGSDWSNGEDSRFTTCSMWKWLNDWVKLVSMLAQVWGRSPIDSSTKNCQALH